MRRGGPEEGGRPGLFQVTRIISAVIPGPATGPLDSQVPGGICLDQ